MSNDPSVLSDKDAQELTPGEFDHLVEIEPGQFKRVGDCTSGELGNAADIEEEKARLAGEIVELKQQSGELGITLPRRQRRDLAKLEDTAFKSNRVADLRRVHNLFSVVVNRSGEHVV